jgi:hypothetical protein
LSDFKSSRFQGGIRRALAVRLVFPLMILCAKLLRLDFDKTASKLINLNNHLTLKSTQKYQLKRILVLVPHCLQHSGCELKINSDISKCKGCGKCDIEKLASLSKDYNLNINIAAGGSSALRLIKEVKPQVVAAVACERDLVSGIRDIYPIPVIAICNTRPEGPCKNTRVDTKIVEDVLRFVTKQ